MVEEFIQSFGIYSTKMVRSLKMLIGSSVFCNLLMFHTKGRNSRLQLFFKIGVL